LGQLTINGQAPMAELADYQTRLNAMTAGQGRYTLALSHYEAVPPAVQQQLTSRHAAPPAPRLAAGRRRRTARQPCVAAAAGLAGSLAPCAGAGPDPRAQR
jgi:translation elongation factor EF-G